MGKTVYVLGTSEDLNRLETSFYRQNITIGINGGYEAVARRNEQFDHWIAHDQYFAFHPWVQTNAAPDTHKWVLKWYARDERIRRMIPGDNMYNKKYANHLVHTYNVRPFHVKPCLDPDVTMDRSMVSLLDDYQYTIFTAISLAVGLGYDDIRLRGVSLSGDYFGGKIECNRDAYYYDIAMTFRKMICPALKMLGIAITNETVDAEFDLKEWM